MTAGRPSVYDASMCDVVVEMGTRGMCKTEIAIELGVSRQTLYNWIDQHPEFLDAIKKAEDAAEAWYYRTFRHMATGGIKNANPTALIFAAKNQLPDVFRDRREHKVDGEVGVFEIDFSGFDEDDDDA